MELPNRKSTRLKGYDYSNPNYYYITICTHNKQHIFGEADCLNDYGKIAQDCLFDISTHYKNVGVDKFVVMPNHIHAIIVINDSLTERSRPFPTLSSIVGLYKSGVTKRIREMDPKITVWQKSFYDNIIRNEKSYEEIWYYIDLNPVNWETDDLNIKHREF